jgi:hypothetical protein
MAHKIHQRPAKTPPPSPEPKAPGREAPPWNDPTPWARDSFIQGLAAAVYRNHPLVMLCTQPPLRALASKIPVVRDVADAVCPAVEETTKTQN